MPRGDHFSAVQRAQPLHRQVAEQIQALVLSGELRAGQKLPPERELSRRFGVSRTVVREAIKTLEERGLIEIHFGDGTYVVEPTSAAVSTAVYLFLRLASGVTPAACLELCRLVEGELAGLAAQRATGADLAALTALVRRLEEQTVSPHRFARAVVELHQALARVARQDLVLLLLTPALQVLFGALESAYASAQVRRQSLACHHRLWGLIQAHDAPGARQEMQRHLEQVALHL